MRQFELLAMFGPPAGQEQDPKAAMLQMVVTFGILGLMFYFLLIRPQQKQRKDQENLIKNVKTGDKILLNSGMFGIVSNVKEKSLMVKIADNVKVEVLKSAVGSVVQKSAEVEAATMSNKVKGLEGAIPDSYLQQFRTGFGLTYSNGSWQYEGNESAGDIHNPKECAQVLQVVRSKLSFSQMCILPGRPVSIILNTTPPTRVVTGFNFDGVRSVAELAANLLLEVGGKTGGKTTIVGGFVVVTLP
ncbi:MAG: preprotein translocase subunit YajC [Verrucomicrobiia bacterium]|jgi:preprotein translocase subunit YajC